MAHKGKKLAGTRGTIEEKMAAVQEFYLVGTYSGAARKLGMITNTLRNWVNEPECQKWLIQIRSENEEEFRNRAGRIQMAALQKLEETIENGNTKTAWVDNEDGTKELKTWQEPMNSKDLTYTAGIITDKLRVSLNLPTRITADGSSQTDLLRKFEEIHDRLTEKKVDNSIPGKLN